MIALRHITFACVILFVLNQSVDCLRCYSCKKCQEPFDTNNTNSSSAIASQPDNQGYGCRKIWTALYVERDIQRDCVESNIAGTGTYCCYTDLCNDATKFFSTMFIWLGMGATVLMKLF